MAGVMIYKTKSGCHYTFVSADDYIYAAEKINVPERGDKILWEKENVSLEQIENCRRKKISLVAKLNNDEKIDLEKELAEFFK